MAKAIMYTIYLSGGKILLYILNAMLETNDTAVACLMLLDCFQYRLSRQVQLFSLNSLLSFALFLKDVKRLFKRRFVLPMTKQNMLRWLSLLRGTVFTSKI